MSTIQPQNLKVIGLTGSIGSGCSYIAKNILGRMGYRTVSLSDLLRKRYDACGKGKSDEATTEALQMFGDDLRQTNGAGICRN